MITNPFAASLILLPIFVLSPASAQEGQKSNDQRVRDYVAAFNERQLDTMLSMVTDDLEWLSVSGDKIAVESKGKDALRQSMEAYFKSTPSSQSELLWVQVTPTRVATLEKARWRSTSGEHSQVSLAVYEFRDHLICRVYYYPTEK